MEESINNQRKNNQSGNVTEENINNVKIECFGDSYASIGNDNIPLRDDVYGQCSIYLATNGEKGTYLSNISAVDILYGSSGQYNKDRYNGFRGEFRRSLTVGRLGKILMKPRGHSSYPPSTYRDFIAACDAELWEEAFGVAKRGYPLQTFGLAYDPEKSGFHENLFNSLKDRIEEIERNFRICCKRLVELYVLNNNPVNFTKLQEVTEVFLKRNQAQETADFVMVALKNTENKEHMLLATRVFENFIREEIIIQTGQKIENIKQILQRIELNPDVVELYRELVRRGIET